MDDGGYLGRFLCMGYIRPRLLIKLKIKGEKKIERYLRLSESALSHKIGKLCLKIFQHYPLMSFIQSAFIVASFTS